VKRGFDVTAIDISETAIAKARSRSVKEGLSIDFIRDDILDSRLDRTFDLVLDRGCFHVLDPDRRSDYIETVSRLLEPDGHLFLKCFSHLEPGEDGPYRFTSQQVADLFRSRFEIVSTNNSTFQGNHEPPPRAIFSVLKKRQT